MRFYIVISVLILFIYSCEYEKTTEPIKPNKPVKTDVIQSVYTALTKIDLNSKVWNEANYHIANFDNNNFNKIDTTNGVLNSNGTYNGLSTFNNGDSINLKFKSVYNNTHIYILAEWNDISINADNKKWLFNGPIDVLKPNSDTSNWTSHNNDDNITIKFKSATFTNAIADVWRWSVSQSDPLGYANDMYENSNNQLINDLGEPSYIRNGSNNRSGPNYEWNGSSQTIVKANGAKTILDPSYYIYTKTNFTGSPQVGSNIFKHSCAECHGDNGTGEGEGAWAPGLNGVGLNKMSREGLRNYIINDNHSGKTYANGFTDTDYENLIAYIRGLCGVPGYILQMPTQSCADVFVFSSINSAQITTKNTKTFKVLFYRKLSTQFDDDIQFNTSSDLKYDLSFKLSNNDSINYVGGNTQIIFKKTWNEIAISNKLQTNHK